MAQRASFESAQLTQKFGSSYTLDRSENWVIKAAEVIVLAGNENSSPLLFRINSVLLKNIKTLDQILSFILKLHSSTESEKSHCWSAKNLEAQLFPNHGQKIDKLGWLTHFASSQVPLLMLWLHNTIIEIFANILTYHPHYTINQGRTKTSCKPVSTFKLMSNLKNFLFFR